jgi:hypothetical protein
MRFDNGEVGWMSETETKAAAAKSVTPGSAATPRSLKVGGKKDGWLVGWLVWLVAGFDRRFCSF